MDAYGILQKQYMKVYAQVAIDGTAQSGAAVFSARNTSYRIFVQRVTLSITTHVATKTFSLQDSGGLVLAARTDFAAAAGVPDVLFWDFGPDGAATGIGTNLTYTANAGGTGFVGVLVVEGYQKLAATAAQASTN